MRGPMYVWEGGRPVEGHRLALSPPPESRVAGRVALQKAMIAAIVCVLFWSVWPIAPRASQRNGRPGFGPRAEQFCKQPAAKPADACCAEPMPGRHSRPVPASLSAHSSNTSTRCNSTPNHEPVAAGVKHFLRCEQLCGAVSPDHPPAHHSQGQQGRVEEPAGSS